MVNLINLIIPHCISRVNIFLYLIESLQKLQDIINILYTIALSQDGLQEDNYIAIRILTRLLPHVENNEVYLTDHPIDEFCFLSKLDEVVPLFAKLIELNPNKDQFRSIAQIIYEKTEFNCYKYMVMILMTFSNRKLSLFDVLKLLHILYAYKI